MKEKIKVFFTDFWTEFIISDNFFLDILEKDFEVEINEDNPEILFYSWMGENYKKYKCLRIFYTPENWPKPKYKDCDFSLSFEYWNDLRNLRMPNYILYKITPQHLDKTKWNLDKIMSLHSGFCSMLVSNPNQIVRNNFFNKLNKYKKVDSGGKHLNNIGGRVKDKLEFISGYKFNLCFENAQHQGYTTEKIVEAMRCQTIPLYWGNPLIHFEFNTKSFFNYTDYQNEDEMIEDIIEHDKDDQKYYQKFIKPWFEDNIPNQYFDHQRIRKYLYDIIIRRKKIVPIAGNVFKQKLYYPLGYNINQLKGKFHKLVKREL